MARILLLTTDWYNTDQEQRLKDGHAPAIGGGAFYRLVLPSVALHDAGHEVFLAPNFKIGRDLSIVGRAWLPSDEGGDLVPDADIVITQRWMNRDAKRIMQAAKSTGQKVIVDLDDDYWCLPPDNQAFIGTHPKYNPDANRNHYWASLGAADAILCSTPALMKRVERLNRPTHLLRNMIDLDMWDWHDTTLSDRKPSIGWTGGTIWRTKELRMVAPAVGPFVNKHDLRFAHVGNLHTAPPASMLLGIDPMPDTTLAYPHAGVQKTLIDQLPFDHFSDAVAKCEMDIGIVPLVDNSFNEAKSNLKGMEFAASGIPFIASDLPEYRYLGAGILARKHRDWQRGLERLLDPEERRTLAMAARERVEQEDYRRRGIEWLNAIEHILKS